MQEEVNSGVFQLNSRWSDVFSTEFRASYRDYNRDQTPFGGRDIAQFEVCTDATNPTSGVGATVTTCLGPRVFFGPDISRQSNDLNTENLSVDLIARADLGEHQLKFTAGYTDIDVFNLFLQRSLGDLYFDTIGDFQARRASRLRLQNAVPSLDPNDAAARFSTQIYTIGLQDDWEISDKLTLTLGARYDLYDNEEKPPFNPNFLQRVGFSNRETFAGLGVFQPRFGFNWQPVERLIVRGGVGIFAGGSPDVYLSNSFSNTGQLSNAIDISRSATAPGGCTATGLGAAQAATVCPAALNGVTGTEFPAAVTSFLATNIASLQAAPVNAIDPDFKLPRSLRATLSFNYEADLGFLGDDWLFGVDLLYGNVLEQVQYTDLRSVVIGTLPDGRPRYGPRGGIATTNQDLLLTNEDRGRSYIAAARVSKEWDWGLSFDASYTRSDVKDANALTSSTAGSLYSNNAFLDPNFAAYGTSIYEIKDQWKLGVDYKREFFGDNETRFSLFGEYRTGRPYSVIGLDRSTGRSPIFGTNGANGRQLLYVPNTSDPIVSFDSAATEASFNALVDQLGLGKFRGSIVPKNSQRSPDFFKVDLRVSQELPVPILSGAKIKLFADLENVLNLIDSDWGSLRQVAFPYTASVVDVQCLSTPTGTGTTVVPIGTPAAQIPAGAQAVVNTLPTQTCAQYRYSNVVAPNEALSSRQSLYQIRVGVRFEF